MVPALPPVIDRLGRGGVLVAFLGILGWIVRLYFHLVTNPWILATIMTRERTSFFPKVKRSVPEVPKLVSRDKDTRKPDSVRVSRERSPRGSNHGKEIGRKHRSQAPLSSSVGAMPLPNFRQRQVSPPLMTSRDASVARSPQGRKLKRTHSRSRSGVVDVVDGAVTNLDSHRQDFPVLAGLGCPNPALASATSPRRTKKRASSSLGARPPSPLSTGFNRSSVSGAPASSFDENRVTNVSVASVPANTAFSRLREMMEVVSPLVNPDRIDPPTVPQPRASYGSLSLLAVGPVALPTAPLVLGLPSSTKVLTAALDGVPELGKPGKWVSESALPLRASRFGTNTSHVPIRSKLHPPPLLSKGAKTGL